MSRAPAVTRAATAPGRRRARACLLESVRAGLLLSLLGLTACQPAGPGVDSAGPVPVAAATGASALEEELKQPIWQELERIEREGRSHPAASEHALHELQPRTAPGSLARVQLLAQRGHLATEMRNAGLTASILKDLEEWPAEASRRAAHLALLYVRARQQRFSGDLRQAERTMAPLAGYSVRETGPRLLLRCHDFMAYLQAETGQIDDAIASANEALRLADGMGQPWRRALVMSNLAFIYHQAQQLELAQQFSVQSQAEANLDPSPALLYDVHTTRGIILQTQGWVGQAQQAKQAALDAARQSGSDALIALALGNFADFHLNQGNYPQALEFSEQALALAIASQNIDYELLSRHNRGIAKIGLKRIEEGKREVLEALARDEQRGADTNAANAWLELGMHLERAGDLPAAVDAFHQHRRRIDQVLRNETRKALLESQESYEDERRAKEIELLNRGNSLKQEQLRARDLQLWLWAALGGCIVLSAVLLGLAYQRIRRTNQALAHSNAALKTASERDPLTGLANRRHFLAAIKRLAEHGQISGSLFLIDIDHFKRINDRHGHAAGDSVLIEIAQRLRACLRDEDLLVRWGGEEFLILVNTREASFASTLAQRLLDQIAWPTVKHGTQGIPVTASIGFASFPMAPHELALVWERAIDLVDTAMYLAKAHGRNQAYGIASVAAVDEVQLQSLAGDMEASWQAGQLELITLHGPARFEDSRQ
ncbi:sensor domain-containing diguanylate cyclase [Paucibacter sp. DJ2R-2]|uniref:GGDEF domain-containing protein n=1 Tax=Paucibacter sp. DJ2R-2 TaxID=2893558 RepID=UPI0021E4BA5D|nr:tetratricopeptide repeat-containing diguanylate cyclase [Paucibacter sp. DJ2R-2]MCV2419172.1 diguanylate cyclase [Paucibacter sp. DJ4R-1]MCV2437873.1 diguanylate cyclase [Paucibacter sp. DJ2R-2]